MIASRSTSWSALWSLAQLRAREGCSTAARPDGRSEERLVSVNVPHTTQQILVQQRTFDRGLAAPEKSEESLDLRVQWLVTRSHESVAASDSIRTTASLPNRRGSTKRNSRPEASFRTA